MAGLWRLSSVGLLHRPTRRHGERVGGEELNGKAYVGPFFTRRNIERFMTQVLPENGECAGGAYFWSTDMTIVGRLTKDTDFSAWQK